MKTKNCDTTHEDNNIKVSTVTPYKAGKILGKNAETIRFFSPFFEKFF